MSSRVVTVEIAGQQYPIRSTLDERYVATLASYVEQKMAAASSSAPSSDTVGLAILVALNLADELFRARDQESSALGELNDRAMRLERIVDDVLAEGPPQKPITLLDHPRSAG
jgi:cell division protein ZapA